MRYLGIVSYDGGAYQGWQRQPDAPSIQQKLEEVLSLILNMPISIYGSGRTDAGVHANGQAFHFDCDKTIVMKKLLVSVNSLLPHDIHLHRLKRVPDAFHARYNVKYKHYRYLINNNEYSPFLRRYAMQIRHKLDIGAMKEASQLFVGTHNFQDFTTKDGDKDGYVREVYEVRLSRHDGLLRIDVVGSGFMTYMVRFIVGTLVAIGQGREPIDFISKHLDSNQRNVVSYKGEPQGLYLYEVGYK